MRILIGSTLFPPSCGGVETVMSLLAQQFVELGHDVKVVTGTSTAASTAFEVIAGEGRFRRAHLRWCDVVVQSCMTLRHADIFLSRVRPALVIHHTWYRRPAGSAGVRDVLKQYVCRSTRNVAVSSAVAKHLWAPATVIGNPYDDDVFVHTGGETRDIDIAFVGRLVGDKGADLLVDAIAQLEGYRAIVIGTGPEEASIRSQIRRYGLESRIELAGELLPRQVAEILRRTRVLAIPSRWEEPFGLVALEGIASGCRCVASDGGGLSEAVGSCGTLFPRNDVVALARALSETLSRTNTAVDRSLTEAHLASHKKRFVAQSYLSVLEELTQ